MTTIQTIFENANASSFIGLDTLTTVPLLGGKKNPMKDRVTKANRGASIMVFGNINTNSYENMVKKRLTAEGKNPDDFELAPLSWGERIEGTPIIAHKGKYYVQCILLTAGKSEYFLDGQPIDKNDIEGLKPARASKQGGLTNTVMIRTYAIDSIDRLKINRVEYKRGDISVS